MDYNEVSRKDIERMERKIDNITDALTNPTTGTHVRLTRIETRLDAIDKKANDACTSAEAADDKADKALAQGKVQWWFIGIIVLAIFGIAIKILESGIVP